MPPYSAIGEDETAFLKQLSIRSRGNDKAGTSIVSLVVYY
jgi:hypothetical protein